MREKRILRSISNGVLNNIAPRTNIRAPDLRLLTEVRPDVGAALKLVQWLQ
jgi:hypothetical protein